MYGETTSPAWLPSLDRPQCSFVIGALIGRGRLGVEPFNSVTFEETGLSRDLACSSGDQPTSCDQALREHVEVHDPRSFR